MSFTSSKVELRRIDAAFVQVDTPSGLDIRLFANERVPVDRASIAEIAALSEVAASVSHLNDRGVFGPDGGSIERCVLTPDFHKGAGIPVGTVLQTRGLVFPRAAGGDIGCGMRLVATDMTRSEFDGLGPDFARMLRHAFFEGGRDLPLSERGREAVLRHGVPGLREAAGGGGLWAAMSGADLDADVAHSHHGGRWDTDDLWMFGGYAKGSGGVSRDAALGSIGGGNHFAEFGCVEERLDGAAAYTWGLKRGCVTIMVHTGSVGIGSQVGDHFMRVARDIHPPGTPHHRTAFTRCRWRVRWGTTDARTCPPWDWRQTSPL